MCSAANITRWLGGWGQLLDWHVCVIVCVLAVSDLLDLTSYESFSSFISEAVGTDPSATQLALFFRLTQDMMSSEAAKGVMGWAKTYYRQKLAPWVANQNGLVSITQVIYSLCSSRILMIENSNFHFQNLVLS